jgi:FAD dependent oxidoreductase
MRFIIAFLIFFYTISFRGLAQKTEATDVLVIGGGTGGTAAGIQCARMGVKTLIVEQTNWLGGMLTAAGVSCTDGNNALAGGIWKEFREALYKAYGTRNLASGWVSETCFEPHTGDSIFKSWVAKEKNLAVIYDSWLLKIIKDSAKIIGAVFENGKGEEFTVKAKITIDATESGDALASAGEEYDLGTEDPIYSGEAMAPGKTNIIQDLTWVAILKDYGAGSARTIPKPEGYDPKDYYCCCTSAKCTGKPYNADAQKMLDYAKLPNHKYMINWPAHGNDYYLNVVEQDPKEREREYKKVRLHTLGFIYFIQSELGFSNLGLANDELEDGMALMPYNREGRRMRGMVRFRINDILKPFDQPEKLYRTGIAVGDYPVDHHHGQNPSTPPIEFPPIPSFNLPMGAMIPAKTDGLIVCEKGISVSNIVNGATRLQPIVLLTGQAAGILAGWSIRNKKQPREADLRSVQQQLLHEGCYIMPYADLKPEDPYWEAIQRVGAAGILRGVGKPGGWENKTFFYPDTPALYAEFRKGLNELGIPFKGYHPFKQRELTGNDILSVYSYFSNKKNGSLPVKKGDKSLNRFFESFHFENKNMDRPLKRREAAALLDYYLDLFNFIKIDLKGIPLIK